MAACDLCRIAAGEADAHVLLRTADSVAFLDARPAIDGHALVVPTVHERFLFDAPESVTRSVFSTVRRVANAMEDVLDADGYSLFHTSADFVGTVEHAHVHLLPRTTDDRVHVALERTALDDDVAEVIAERLRSGL